MVIDLGLVDGLVMFLVWSCNDENLVFSICGVYCFLFLCCMLNLCQLSLCWLFSLCCCLDLVLSFWAVLLVCICFVDFLFCSRSTMGWQSDVLWHKQVWQFFPGVRMLQVVDVHVFGYVFVEFSPWAFSAASCCHCCCLFISIVLNCCLYGFQC